MLNICFMSLFGCTLVRNMYWFKTRLLSLKIWNKNIMLWAKYSNRLKQVRQGKLLFEFFSYLVTYYSCPNLRYSKKTFSSGKPVLSFRYYHPSALCVKLAHLTNPCKTVREMDLLLSLIVFKITITSINCFVYWLS